MAPQTRGEGVAAHPAGLCVVPVHRNSIAVARHCGDPFDQLLKRIEGRTVSHPATITRRTRLVQRHSESMASVDLLICKELPMSIECHNNSRSTVRALRLVGRRSIPSAKQPQASANGQGDALVSNSDAASSIRYRGEEIVEGIGSLGRTSTG